MHLNSLYNEAVKSEFSAVFTANDFDLFKSVMAKLCHEFTILVFIKSISCTCLL